MENNKQELGSWVDARLASLNALGEWQPNAAQALALLRRRDRTRRVQRAGWIGATAAAMAACLILLTLAGPKACANPVECANEAPQAAPKLPGLISNYKESGSPSARVTVEIYSDYQCPSCAAAFLSGAIPPLVAEYVKTGKVKLVHRDYPLPQHPYARLAARYANAAGRLGFYDATVAQLFKTQGVWEKDGSIDAQLVPVLPPGVIQRVRQMAQSDSSLDETVTQDLTMGATDKINQTPTMVVVANGKRQIIVPIPNYAFLKSYLDGLLR